MAEDRQHPMEEQDSPPPAPQITRGQQRRRQRSVFQYVTILFAAALVLLLYTFMMERRQFEQQQEQDQANISDLQQQSTSAVQRLEGLIAENEHLKAERDRQEDQLAELPLQLDTAEEEQGLLQAEIQGNQRCVMAMDYFWQINEAYVRGKYNLCRSLIEDMGESLAASLPDFSFTDNGRFSPAARYQEIYDKVMK